MADQQRGLGSVSLRLKFDVEPSAVGRLALELLPLGGRAAAKMVRLSIQNRRGALPATYERSDKEERDLFRRSAHFHWREGRNSALAGQWVCDRLFATHQNGSPHDTSCFVDPGCAPDRRSRQGR